MNKPGYCLCRTQLRTRKNLIPWAPAFPASSPRFIWSASSYSTQAPRTSHQNPDINPPPTSRPAKLELPTRSRSLSPFKYYYLLGKAYVNFYKTGLRAVLSNRRLVSQCLASLADNHTPSSARFPRSVLELVLGHPRPPPPDAITRADWVLVHRVRSDLLRLPLFGLVLLVCGEFTPLLALWLHSVIPRPCWVPRQVGSTLEREENRRNEAFARLGESGTDTGVAGVTRSQAQGHALSVLGLRFGAPFWGGVMPASVRWRVGGGSARLAYLAGDDALLMRSSEGISGLLAEEVRIACSERGIDVLGKKDGELRATLGDWLRLTRGKDTAERRKRMAILLLMRQDKWAKTRDLALPSWEI